MSNEVRAGLIALVLVALAAGIGVAAGVRARPTPTPRPTPAPTVQPTPTPVDPAELERRAFAQPLSTGCATARAVWLFADGGAAIRWDGLTWAIPDPTLRSLLAAECDNATALAVGRGGQILTIDDELREVRVDQFGSDDLVALSRSSIGALAVGSGGTFAQQTQTGWRSGEAGITEDLLGVTSKDPRALITVPFAWVVGAGGATYRLMEQGRWEKVATGTSGTLRAVVHDSGGAIAVGDRGAILRVLDGTAEAKAIPSGTEVALRDLAIVGVSTVWIVGDGGTVIELSGEAVRRVELNTTCTLRAVFAQGSAIWVVGSDGTRGGAWRVAPARTDRWGSC